MGALDRDAPEGEIGEAGVKLGFGMAPQKAPADMLVMRPRRLPDDGEARMRQRVAFAALGEQERAARVALKLQRMLRQAR